MKYPRKVFMLNKFFYLPRVILESGLCLAFFHCNNMQFIIFSELNHNNDN